MPDARRRDLRRWRDHRDRRRRRGPAAGLTGGLVVVAVASAIILVTAPGASAPTAPATLALTADDRTDRAQDAASRSAERTAGDETEPVVPSGGAVPSAGPTPSAAAGVAPAAAPDESGAATPGDDGAAPPAAEPATRPAATEPEPQTAPVPAGDAGAAMASDVVALTNERRAEAGLAPLGVSACATEQAVARAGVLVAEGRFEHDPLGPVLDACRAGTVGENLSLGYPSAQAAVTGWMGSPGHRENILRASYAQVGVGCVPGGRGWLCAQVFVG